MNRARKYVSVILIFVLGIVEVTKVSVSIGKEVVYISDFSQLKVALEEEGRQKIRVTNTVLCTESLYVKGSKTIVGNGFSIQRGNSFRGNLFVCRGAGLTLTDVTVDGSGEGIYGRLIVVEKGKVLLEKGCVLKNNQNKRSATDGGGAVRIEKGGKVTMNAGVIKENVTVSAGAAIYIKRGGTFILNGGTICDNTVKGIGPVEGFDGRGGAIWNAGEFYMNGGMISHNTVTAYQKDGISYGGAGGMLYNAGNCVIKGGKIRNNQALVGGAVYCTKNSTLRLLGGVVERNRADIGSNVYKEGEKKKVGKETIKKDVKEKQKQPSGEKQKRNRKPQVKTVKRVFFTWETAGFDEKKWSEVLLKECAFFDDSTEVDMLTKKARVYSDKLLKNNPGTYQVRLTVKDREGEKVSKNIVVLLVEEYGDNTSSEEKRIRVRPCGNEDFAEEVWHFSKEDRIRAKHFMREQKNPFSRETNQMFFDVFSQCCRKVGRE